MSAIPGIFRYYMEICLKQQQQQSFGEMSGHLKKKLLIYFLICLFAPAP